MSETEKAKPAKKAKAKPEAGKAAAPAPKAKKEIAGGLRVTQTGSAIGRQSAQQATLIGLGLNKRHRSRVLADTPETRGMIEKVKHLVKVEKA